MAETSHRRAWSDEKIHNEFTAVKYDIEQKHMLNRVDIEALKLNQVTLVKSA